MRQIVKTKIYWSLITLSFVILIPLAATAQTDFVSGSPATQLAKRGEKAVQTQTADDVCEARLLKALDALEKAEKALNSALTEIEARKRLDDLKNEYLAVKDMIIAEQGKLITFLQKKNSSPTSKIMQILKIAEKASFIVLGVIVGRGL